MAKSAGSLHIICNILGLVATLAYYQLPISNRLMIQRVIDYWSGNGCHCPGLPMIASCECKFREGWDWKRTEEQVKYIVLSQVLQDVRFQQISCIMSCTRHEHQWEKRFVYERTEQRTHTHTCPHMYKIISIETALHTSHACSEVSKFEVWVNANYHNDVKQCLG